MNRRRLIMISSIVVACIVLIVIAIWLFWDKDAITPTDTTNTNATVQTNTNTTTTNTNADNGTTDTTVPTTIDRDDRQAISSAARSFTERFGSYSSDTDFENIERSRYLMTADMNEQANQIMRQSQTSAEFVSVEITAAGVEIIDYSDGSTGATVNVTARKTERNGQNAPVYSNTTARITLEKEGDRWLVDSFRWL